jgi:L,D-transpeptidase-like protein
MIRSRSRIVVLLTLIAQVSALLVGPSARAVFGNGRAANAAKFVGQAELPVADALDAAPTDTLVADAAIASVPIFESPDAAEPVRSMKNPTREGVLLIFGVIEEQKDWLKVMLPMRPNGTTGWVRASDVRVRKVSNRIEIDRSDRKLRAFKGGEMLLEVPIAVGKSVSPTPLAKAYVDISVPFKNTGGAYGAHMLSVAAYSEVLTNFGGGVGQIAIHGTNARGSVGKEASNGCIRLYNEDILRLKDLAPTGTPVDIVA